MILTSGEILFVDTVAKTFRNASDDCAPNLTSGHLSELSDTLVAVERRVGRADHVRAVFQWTYTHNQITLQQSFSGTTHTTRSRSGSLSVDLHIQPC